MYAKNFAGVLLLKSGSNRPPLPQSEKFVPYIPANICSGKKCFWSELRKVSSELRKVSSELSVPDRRCRIIPEVVLVRRWAVGVLGIWRGEGLGKGWNKGGQFTSNLRPRWTDPVTARRVPSK